MAIQMRRGNDSDFDPNLLVPGEMAVSQDAKKVYCCFAKGVVIQLAVSDRLNEVLIELDEALSKLDSALARAKTNADLSQSYAVGTNGEVRSEDITDNSKAYKELSEIEASSAISALESINDVICDVTPAFNLDTNTGHLNYTIGVPRYSFSNMTDRQITLALAMHYAGRIDLTQYWKVGDERPVHLSAMAATGVSESHVEQNQTLVILHGPDMFDLVDGGKNTFVIGLKNFLANGTTREGGYINSTDTNVGGWKESARRPWCDNVFMPALPTEVQKWFKKFKYLAGKGNQSTEVDTLENYFTFPSQFEAFGINTYSAAENTIQMDYYKTQSNRIKYPGDSGEGSASFWWLRSPNTTSAASFRYVLGNGGASNSGASYARGLAPFGCI